MTNLSNLENLLAEYLAADPSSKPRRQWAARCRELFDITCSVPADERLVAPQHLVNWTQYQRRRAHLSDIQVDCLNMIPGWSWGEREDRWYQQRKHVETFMVTHGRAPRPEGMHLLPGEQSLGRWLKRQREAQGKQTLTATRKATLDNLPLPWR